MIGNLPRARLVCAVLFGSVLCASSCDRPSVMRVRWGSRARPYTGTDSMGAAPTAPSSVPIHTRALPENSAAAMSRTQPGVLFTINDSGNEPVLYAIDTTGALRGAWRVNGASNVDWEAASIGPCATGGVSECVYIGDTGDNDAVRSMVTIYRVAEPRAQTGRTTTTVDAQRLDFAYPDGPHDVEAMYIAPNGDSFLITKRASADAAGHLRPALVFRLAASMWSAGARVTAERVDSLDVVPGSAPLRVITDAALSPNGRHLAVRTYMQVYVFATDSATGRVDHRVAPSVCNVVSLGEAQGEGITWIDDLGRFALTSEGRDSPLELASCPLPH